MAPSEDAARSLAKEALNRVQGSEIVSLELSEHKEGRQFQYRYKINHPRSADKSLLDVELAADPPFDAVRVRTELSGGYDADSAGIIRCFYDT
jgi:hypothetical protein